MRLSRRKSDAPAWLGLSCLSALLLLGEEERSRETLGHGIVTYICLTN